MTNQLNFIAPNGARILIADWTAFCAAYPKTDKPNVPMVTIFNDPLLSEAA